MTLRYNEPYELDYDIPVSDMNSGEVGIITKWGGITEHVGVFVERVRDYLFSFEDERYWTLIPGGQEFRVRLLPNGATFTVVNNEGG